MSGFLKLTIKNALKKQHNIWETFMANFEAIKDPPKIQFQILGHTLFNLNNRTDARINKK